MDYDGVTIRTTKVTSQEESDALDAALELKEICFRVPCKTYKLLEQLAVHNGINMPHLLRTIIEQRLKV